MGLMWGQPQGVWQWDSKDSSQAVVSRRCRSIFCPRQRIVENKYVVQASVEVSASEIWGEVWVKK